MKLTVKLVAGKELPRMDRFGLCDPFVKIEITSIPPTRYKDDVFENCTRFV
jgi:hypothetical protein